MIVFPNAKINLGLRVLEKRKDGFHNIETIFYPITLKDALEVISAEAPEATSFATSGIQIDGQPHDNICMKAVQMMKDRFPTLPPLKICLHKNIPTGAGLGGGSADGAFMLRLLNEKFHLGLDEQQLGDIALQLGSDCPFFILNKPALGTGRGEQLTPIGLDLSSYTIVIVNPRIHINTSWAFSKIIPNHHQTSLREFVNLPVHQWRDYLHNDFEKPVFEEYPEIADIKNVLYKNGALYAALSGSGSTVFGIFDTTPSLPDFPPHYFVKIV